MATFKSEEYKNLLSTLGRAGLHSLFPNEFEYYMMALELVNSQGDTIDYFTFPIMPQTFTQTSVSLVNIKKSAGGVTALSTPTFIPIDINFQGNFGRILKVMVGKQEVSFPNLSVQNGIFSKEQFNNLSDFIVKKPIFSPRVKTGYGAIKVLEGICDKSSGLDEKTGQPYSLYFHNMALGHSYLVKVINLVLSQNKEASNMIWNYNLTLKAIAPLEYIKKSTKIFSLLAQTSMDVLNKGLNKVARDLKKELNFKKK